MPSDAVRSGSTPQSDGAGVVLGAALQRVLQEKKKEREQESSVSRENERQLEMIKYRAIFAVDDDRMSLSGWLIKKAKRQAVSSRGVSEHAETLPESVINLFSIEV